MTTASDPNLRKLGTPLGLPKSDVRPASDINLGEVLSISSQSPSVSCLLLLYSCSPLNRSAAMPSLSRAKPNDHVES